MTKNRQPFGMLNQTTREALETLLSYLWAEEQRSYEEDPREDHVFLALQTVRIWLERLPEPRPGSS